MNGFGSGSSGTLIAPNGESVGSAGSPQRSQSPTSAAAPSQSTSGTHAASSVRGDVNGDGKLNIMDILLAQRSILGLGKLRAEEIARADLNGNGKSRYFGCSSDAEEDSGTVGIFHVPAAGLERWQRVRENL
ncbi:MAG: dockerin type I repeat-containing protein [Clostridium fessum]